MNPFNYLQEAFIWLTQLFVWAAIWFYSYAGLPGFLGDLAEYLGDFFRDCSDATATIAGQCWSLSQGWDFVIGRLQDILSEADIWSLLSEPLTWARDAWGWVSDHFKNVAADVTAWWSAENNPIRVFIKEATKGLGTLQDAWNNFWNTTFPQWTGKLDILIAGWDNFWKVTLPTLVDFNYITTWWMTKFKLVDDLMKTRFVEYSKFWEGWQDVREEVSEFFADPLQWCYNKLDEFFERFW